MKEKKIYSVTLILPRHVTHYKLREYCNENNITMKKGKFNKVFIFSCEDEHQLDLLKFKFPVREFLKNDNHRTI